MPRVAIGVAVDRSEADATPGGGVDAPPPADVGARPSPGETRTPPLSSTGTQIIAADLQAAGE
jgi:hypothetical protein